MPSWATGGSRSGGKIGQYDPPGFLSDFDKIPGIRDQWSKVVSAWFDEVIAAEEEALRPSKQECQYYNQLTRQPSPVLEQSIVWNAFSGTLLRRYGEAAALDKVEQLLPLTERQDGPGAYREGKGWKNFFYRPHDEYCEWRVERDREGKIERVVFTSEPPEYWQALYGGMLPNLEEKPTYEIDGDPQVVLDLYREHVSPDVRPEDLVWSDDMYEEGGEEPVLIYPKGSYNPYNRWNTTDGIMHLTQPANSLGAEIKLGGDGTILRQRFGRRITDPEALICGAGYGGANRCSDPTIGAAVNELAALGCWVTLRNPVGLYMSHLEMSGWTKPDGTPIEPEYFQIVRGRPGLIERAVFEVPAGEDFTVSDVCIGGVPITHGGQLAHYMTVHLVGLAAAPGTFKPEAIDCRSSALINLDNPDFLIQTSRAPGANEVPAFAYPDVRS